MVNDFRCVPIQKIDLLSLYGTILTIANVSFAVKAAKDVVGNVDITGTGSAGTCLVNQPVKSIDLKSGVTSATVYFCAAYDFESILVAGSAATISAEGVALADVLRDGASLYKAVLADGTVTISAVTPSLT